MTPTPDQQARQIVDVFYKRLEGGYFTMAWRDLADLERRIAAALASREVHIPIVFDPPPITEVPPRDYAGGWVSYIEVEPRIRALEAEVQRLARAALTPPAEPAVTNADLDRACEAYLAADRTINRTAMRAALEAVGARR